LSITGLADLVCKSTM